MNMRTTAAILTAALLSGSALADGMPQQPDAPHLALLNGSVVQIVPGAAGHVTIVYVQPRPGLWGKVMPGAVLLQGHWSQDRLQATVYGYNPCGFFPYQVAGSVNPDGVLTVVGPTPLIDNASCAVIGWSWTTVAATLSFVPWQRPF